MFRRRRMFRWSGARRTRPAIPPPLLRRLQLAHGLMELGQHAQAATAFEELAAQGEQRGLPQASRLYVQAGRAWAKAGQPARALERIRHGLADLKTAGRVGLVSSLAARLTMELSEMGFAAEAEALASEFEPHNSGSVSGWRPPASEVRLPEKCPYCGGTVRPDEVEWIGQAQALCNYCGSAISEMETPIG